MAIMKLEKYIKGSIVFLAVLLTISCNHDSGVQNGANGKLFIIGGGKRPPELVKRMVIESGINNKRGYGIILPMASIEPDSSIWYARKQFLDIGVENVYGINFSDQNFSKGRYDSLRNAKLIYISGGSQSRFLDTIRGSKVKEIIIEAFHHGALIAGTSAGAALMSTKMITGDEKKHPEYHSTYRHLEMDNMIVEDGLGLLDYAIIDQHFIKRSRYNRLLTALAEYPDLIGIGIDESTALLLHGYSAEVVGESQVITFQNTNPGSLVVENGKFGLRNIKINIFIPGKRFLFDKL